MIGLRAQLDREIVDAARFATRLIRVVARLASDRAVEDMIDLARDLVDHLEREASKPKSRLAHLLDLATTARDRERGGR